MAGLRKCANKDNPHYTDDPYEMFCMECGLHYLPAEDASAPKPEVGGGSAIPASAVGEMPIGVAPTIMQISGIEVVLTFPWGEERMTRSLGIGREAWFSPLASRLESYLTVSGIHAEFHLRGLELVLVHRGSSNPTYLNGRELPRDVEVVVPDGARVLFSNHCECTVRIEA